MTSQASKMLTELLSRYDLTRTLHLVDFWLAMGVSLALAEPILKQCARSMLHLRGMLGSHAPNRCSDVARFLLDNSDRPLQYDRETTLASFVGQFCDENIRWETLGIFLSAAIRATSDIPFFPGLYISVTERSEFRTHAIRLANHALELCLILDGLNDLQLIFQYENSIVRACVDGDQSRSRSLNDKFDASVR